ALVIALELLAHERHLDAEELGELRRPPRLELQRAREADLLRRGAAELRDAARRLEEGVRREGPAARRGPLVVARDVVAVAQVGLQLPVDVRARGGGSARARQ